MIASALLLAYLGVALWYVASPATPRAAPSALSQRALRLAGSGAMVASLLLLVLAMGVATGLLVGLSALMLVASLLVIAVPLVPRFVPVSLAVVAVLTLVAWVA